MSFIPTPLEFRVRAKVEGSNIVLGTTVVLVKYLRDEERQRSRPELASCGSKETLDSGLGVMKIRGVALGDGSLKLDTRWWTIRDVGPAGPSRLGYAEVRLARLEFNGSDFCGQFPDQSARTRSPASLALYDTFLEQGKIALQVETDENVVSTLVLKMSYG